MLQASPTKGVPVEQFLSRRREMAAKLRACSSSLTGEQSSMNKCKKLLAANKDDQQFGKAVSVKEAEDRAVVSASLRHLSGTFQV